MKLMELINKIHIIFALIRLVRNWPILMNFLFNKKNNVVVKLRNDLLFHVNNTSDLLPIIENFSAQNDHDYFKEALIPVNAKILDVGANIGTFSIHTSKRFPDAEIICCEPDVENYQKLLKNLASNKINNVKPHNLAMGKTNGKIILYSDEDGNFGTAISSTVVKGMRAVEVNCVTLQHFLEVNQINQLDFLKMDCEGAEYDIIMSSNEETLNKINSIALEYHEIENHKSSNLETFLKSRDFLVRKYPRNKKLGFIYAKKIIQ